MAKEPLIFAGQSPKDRVKYQETELGALEAKGTCQSLPAPLRGAVPLISDLLLDLMNYLMPELWIVMEITHLMKDTNWLYSKPARCSDQIPGTCRQSSRAHPNSLLRNNDNEAVLNLGDTIQSIDTRTCGQGRMFCRPKCCPVAIPPSSLWGEGSLTHVQLSQVNSRRLKPCNGLPRPGENNTRGESTMCGVRTQRKPGLSLLFPRSPRELSPTSPPSSDQFLVPHLPALLCDHEVVRASPS